MLLDVPQRRTHARVDLEALSSNLEVLAERAGGAGVILPVKADAYGHGIIPVARHAVAEGVAMLAVANAQELALLRLAGVTHPTLVLEDLFADEIPAVVIDSETRFNVSSLEYARILSDAAQAAGVEAVVHVNVDTGMGRMGLLSDDPVGAVRRIAALPGLRVEGIFTHFPDADESDLGFAEGQLARFHDIVSQLEDSGIGLRYRHIANSAAIAVFGEHAGFDLVRPGVSAYGMFPSPVVAEKMKNVLPLRPCMSLVSAIAKLSTYDRNWTVGYGRTYTVSPGSKIAVVPIGYGDGYRRALSNQGEALVHGMRVPVCGRVSMDMITLDLTGLPEEPNVGDEVVLLGQQLWPAHESGAANAAPEGGAQPARHATVTAEEMATKVGTISYEITCGLTPRVPRVYV